MCICERERESSRALPIVVRTRGSCRLQVYLRSSYGTRILVDNKEYHKSFMLISFAGIIEHTGWSQMNAGDGHQR